MGLLDRLRRWTTLPDAGPATYRCTNCSAVVDDAESACPECGGDVEELVPEPYELYWPHH